MSVKQEYRQLKSEEVGDTEVDIWMMPDPETDTQFYKAEWDNGEYEGRRSDKRDLILFLRRLEIKADEPGKMPEGEFTDEDDVDMGEIILEAQIRDMSKEEVEMQLQNSLAEKNFLQGIVSKIRRLDFTEEEKQRLLPTLKMELEATKSRIDVLRDKHEKTTEGEEE
ncbi:MAG: hypothetical protein ABEJ56_05720 [Candidatus Nanohaloarchaea archaeon]